MRKFSFNLKKEALLLTDAIDRRYFSGIEVAEGFLIVSDKKAYFTDARYNYAVSALLDGKDVSSNLYRCDDDIKAYLKNNGIKTVYLNFEKTFVSDLIKYKKLGVKIKDCSDFLKSLRQIKNENELDDIKTACKIAQTALYETISLLKEGITELEFKDALVKNFLLHGASGESFDTIVAFGENSAVPHHVTGNTKLIKDSVVLIDTGCVYNGYCSDITRTLFFGTPTDEFIKTYDLVLKANKDAINGIYAGISGFDADKLARDVLKDACISEYFTHSLGHGIGLEIHESPYLSPKSKDILLENTVFSVEPGVYFNGKFGIRIEDTVMLKDSKAVRLFNDDKNLIVL
ncbi:MAG: aminopeptidase P family protein [Clostridia bacterium]|nr:aminopeptidase P family protein [Clostridia bacterium]